MNNTKEIWKIILQTLITMQQKRNLENHPPDADHHSDGCRDVARNHGVRVGNGQLTIDN